MISPTNRNAKTKKSELGKDVIKLQKIKYPEIEHKLPQVVTPSRPRTDAKGKTIVQKSVLASFGIKPAQRKSFSNNRDTKLKCCVIETPINNSIIFCFEPINKNVSSWSEKLLFDELRRGTSWIGEMNFDELCYNWHDKLVPQQNNKGFPIRLFCINIETTTPPFDVLVSVGKHICEHVNSYQDKDFIWINRSSAEVPFRRQTRMKKA